MTAPRLDAGGRNFGRKSLIKSKNVRTFNEKVQSKCLSLKASKDLWTPVAAQNTNPERVPISVMTASSKCARPLGLVRSARHTVRARDSFSPSSLSDWADRSSLT